MHMSRPQQAARRRAPVRLEVTELEERRTPTTYQSPFFLDSQHRLWAATSASGDFVNTGGFGQSLSVGTDTAGNQIAVIRDFNSQVYVFDQGTWTATGGYARDLVAGINGEVFVRDFNNLVYHYQLGVGWGIAHSPGTGSFLDFYAVQMSLGRAALTDPLGRQTSIENVLFIRSPSNRVLEYQDNGTQPTWTDTGAFAIDIAAGYDGDAFLRDSKNQLYFVLGNQVTKTSGVALSLAVGQYTVPSGGATDYVAFRDTNNQVRIYMPAIYGPQIVATNGYATQVVAGSNEIYIRDLRDGIHFYDIASGRWTDTHGFGNLIRDTTNDATPNTLTHFNVDQLAVLDLNNQLHIYNGASWTAFPFTALDVEGFQTANFTPAFAMGIF